MVRLGELTWTETDGLAGSAVLAVPVGSTEQHGPHLPLCTDTLVAVELAERLSAARPDVIVAPALPYGASGEHAGFPGTVSIGTAALEHAVIELGRSADAFAAVLVISGHGGNAAALRGAVTTLAAEGRRARVWAPPGGASDAHAGRTETSVLLALRPDLVRSAAAAPGRVEPLSTLMPELVGSGVRAVSPSGVLGDPTGSSAAEGRELLDRWATRLLADLDGWP